MTPEQLAVVILAILGAILQLAFKYGGNFAAWYQDHPQKGTLALLGAVLVGVAYTTLACTQFAAELNIKLACDQSSIFVLLKSIFIIASAQQLTFLYGKGKTDNG